MEEKTMLVDVSKCTACRACQVACKQWNKLPALKTQQGGTHQNPPDLNWATWNLIRFTELPLRDGGMKWLFRRDACLHCTDPGCQRACPVPGCITKTPEGAVVIDQNLCIGCKMCVNSCPFEVPRINPETNKAYKCTLCWNRISNGLIPACAKACAPGTITFGNKDVMIARANARAKALGGDAMVYGDKFVGGTHVLYVLPEKIRMYDRMVVNPSIPISLILWKDVIKPLSVLAIGATLVGTFFHYIIKGPKRPEEGGNEHG
jgi:formate dehydrogenase iron-sulfur subunit